LTFKEFLYTTKDRLFENIRRFMKNTVSILLVVFVLGVVGVFVLKSKSTSKPMEGEMMEESVMEENEMMGEEAHETEMMEDESMDGVEKMDEDGAMMGTEGKYLSFGPQVLESSAGTRRVLFFYANWCPTCNPADASFVKGMKNIPEGVTVIKVNYNDTETEEGEKELAKKYGVTYQHTFVEIDGKGEVVQKWNGGGLDELLVKLQ
jgi:thioredoxin 1